MSLYAKIKRYKKPFGFKVPIRVSLCLGSGESYCERFPVEHLSMWCHAIALSSILYVVSQITSFSSEKSEMRLFCHYKILDSAIA